MNLGTMPPGTLLRWRPLFGMPHCAKENGTSVPKNDDPTSPLPPVGVDPISQKNNSTMISCPYGHFYDGSKYSSFVRFVQRDQRGGITVPYGQEPIPEPAPEGDDGGVTVMLKPEGVQNEPVVGWLVCVKGEDAGKDYPLHTDKNFIGRAANSDVCLSKDKAVSRDRHAIIIYEPRGNVFFAQPGESSKLYYINGQVVLGNVELHAFDRISLGGTELVFVPFCGEHFMWKNPEE